MSTGKGLAKEVVIDIVKGVATQVALVGITNVIGYLFAEKRKERDEKLLTDFSNYVNRGGPRICTRKSNPSTKPDPVKPETASPEDEELARIISVFIARYVSACSHNERILSYKDILCMLGSDLSDILPKISENKRAPFQNLIDVIDRVAQFGISAKDVATDIYEQLQKGGCVDPIF